MPKRWQVVPVMTVGEGETNQLKNIYFRKEILALFEFRLHVGSLSIQLCLSIRNCIKRAPKSTVPGQHRFGFEKPHFCSLQSPGTAFFVTIHGTNHCTFGAPFRRPFTAQWVPNRCSSGALSCLGYGALLRAPYPDLQISDTVRMAVT